MTSQPSGWGEQPGPPTREISRRSFLRNAVGVGVGLLTLQFLGGTILFLYPNLRGGLGDPNLVIGTAADIATQQPEWVRGLPFIYNKARLLIVNIPAGKSRVEGTGEEFPDPGNDIIALYRKCPHLGCNIPQLCDRSLWFECLCHGSKYTILGEKRGGPAPRGMDRFAHRVEDGVYIVDTSVRISGPPIGTATFDRRDTEDIEHCAA
ncbi:MAG: ubiquinol-cytochrome c reductase iron-sulfur subunit [Candidatus Limnocylindria bacterium]